MLRQLVRSFQKSVSLHTISKQVPRTRFYPQCRQLHAGERIDIPLDKAKPNDTILCTSNDTHTDYIVPANAQKYKKITANAIVSTLRTRFRLTDAEVKRIETDEVINRNYKGRALVRNMEMLCLEGVVKSSFIDYPWLLTLDKIRLDLKLQLIKSMQVRDINDFVAYLRLSAPRMRKLVGSLNRESEVVPFGNRIYYISEQLKIEPYIVSKYLSKRLFILEMPFEMLEQNLQHMIEYNVSPINVLKDLWAFRYTPKSVQLRLERAKRAKKDKIMPWMVRCPEPILQRSLKLSLDEIAVLSGKTSAVEYIAERLGFDVREAKAIMDKHPQVHTVRVTKIKEVLDYLLNEAKFTRYEIAQVPRILCHSLETTKERLDELQKLDCRPTSLVIVCRSKREYEKFKNMWIQMKTNKDTSANQVNIEKTAENSENT